VFLLTATRAQAQPVPDYGLDWVTIGDPGNPAAQPEDYFWLQFREFGPVGRVDYEFRLTRTEVTTNQWIEFVDAYARTFTNVNVSDPGFTGIWTRRSSNDPANYGWHALPGAENAAAEMGWLYAAKYCNWLHNGKVNEAWAFDTGAYDISSFHELPSGLWEGNSQHLPGATFWLPSWDEWTKGMHWDPHKSGPGQGGYWMYPHSSDIRPVGGLPGTPGAETSAGDYPNQPLFVPVGSYPQVQSPWGLFDGSGGAAEYLGYWVDGAPDTRGSITGGSIHPRDRLDYLGTTLIPTSIGGGFRVASVVPSPSAASLVVLFALASYRTRSRCRVMH